MKKNLTLWVLALLIPLSKEASGSFSDVFRVKDVLRASQEERINRASSSSQSEEIFPGKNNQRSYDDDDNDTESSSEKSLKQMPKDSKKTEDKSESSSSAAIYGADDVACVGQSVSHDSQSGQALGDSVDLSLSTITLKAQQNKNLSADELKNIALAIIKQQGKSGQTRRSLSRQRKDADTKVKQARVTLETAQQGYQAALENEAAIKQLENDAKGNQERIRNAMELLYSAIMSDPNITDDIKEQWQDAKGPGGKITMWQAAFASCLLL